MGLRVSIYRSDYDSDHNVFHGKTTVTVTNVAGPFEPTDEAPAALLHVNAFGNPIIIPEAVREDAVIGPMMGGTYAATSDSRFGEATGVYAAVPIHDRYETPAAHAALSR